MEFVTGFFRTCPTAGSASGLPPLKRWYVRHTPLITRITTKATALNESGLYKILLGSNNIAQPGALREPGRWRGRAPMPGSCGLAAIGKKKACCSPPPTGGLDFFPGKNPDLGAGSGAGQVARPGFYARRGRHQAAEPSQSPEPLLYVLYVLYLTRQATQHPLSPGPCYMCYMCYMALYSTYTTDFRAYGII